ncbi:MAG: metal ABC transporter substrate-binding protein [Candidatus Polarisedimenticolia bacterium]
MKSVRFAVSILLAFSVFTLTRGAAGPIEVVATLPNQAAIAREVGGDLVKVTAIASGIQDPHFVDPKPSFIVLLRRADLLVVNGLDLEIGWVPPLTQGARNKAILQGGPGYIDTSRSITVMEIPSGPVTRAQGDVHPFGNPHYLTDPLNAELVAGQLAQAFAAKRPDQAAAFETRRADFVRRLHAAMFGPALVDEVGGAKLARLARSGEMEAFLATPAADGRPLSSLLGGWMGRMRPFTGTPVVTYHRDYSYFSQRFGLQVVDMIEPKPGIPPSGRHLQELTVRLQKGDVRLIITRPYLEARYPESLSQRTGVPWVVLPLEVGGAPEATGYFELFDYVTSRIASTLGGGGR